MKGFAAILILNHVSDWLQHKLSQTQRESLKLSDVTPGKQVKEEFEATNPDVLRQIANGFKHLRPVHSSEQVEGYGAGPYG